MLRLTVQATEIQADDWVRSPTPKSGFRRVAAAIQLDGMVNLYWVDGGYYDYRKVSDRIEILRPNHEWKPGE